MPDNPRRYGDREPLRLLFHATGYARRAPASKVIIPKKLSRRILGGARGALGGGSPLGVKGALLDASGRARVRLDILSASSRANPRDRTSRAQGTVAALAEQALTPAPRIGNPLRFPKSPGRGARATCTRLVRSHPSAGVGTSPSVLSGYLGRAGFPGGWTDEVRYAPIRMRQR